VRKSTVDVSKLDPQALRLEMPSERALALRLSRLPEMISQVEEELLPNRLIDYIYGLAGDFTTFYTECPVVGSEMQNSRLLLCEVTRRVLHLCLGFLGIEPLEKL